MAFKKVETVLTARDVPFNIRAQLFNTNILPALTYAVMPLKHGIQLHRMKIDYKQLKGPWKEE